MSAFDDFANVLQDFLLERSRRNMEALVPDGKPEGPLPFAQTPAFFDLYTEVFKVGIFPIVLSRRPVRSLQPHYDWAREGMQQLATILDDRSNPIFGAWDYAWDSLWDEAKLPKESGVKKVKEEKKGLLKSLFGWKGGDKEDVKAVAAVEASAQPLEGLHKLLSQHASRKGYIPLLPDDVRVFRGLIRCSPNRVKEAWKEISQLHNQEFVFSAKEQVKANSTSEAMTKWQYTLPDRLGEFLVIRAAIDLEHINKAYLQKYIRQSARTQEEAEKTMPYVTIYWKSMGASGARG